MVITEDIFSTTILIKIRVSNLSLSQDCSYDLRLMSRSNKILSEPSESVNVSTVGEWLCL